MNGKIDELTVFDHALTAKQITNIVTVGSSGKCRPVKIISDQKQADGSCNVSVAVSPGLKYRLEASGNLSGWSAISTNTATGSILLFPDNTAIGVPVRFYRARQQ